MHSTLDAARLFDDARLVRIVGFGPDPAELLPHVPQEATSSVALGHPGTDTDAQSDAQSAPAAILARGYRLAQIATTREAHGVRLDVLVTADARRHAPDWWRELQGRAIRVFDLRFGPVRHVFQDQLDHHAVALSADSGRAAWRFAGRPAT